MAFVLTGLLDHDLLQVYIQLYAYHIRFAAQPGFRVVLHYDYLNATSRTRYRRPSTLGDSALTLRRDAPVPSLNSNPGDQNGTGVVFRFFPVAPSVVTNCRHPGCEALLRMILTACGTHRCRYASGKNCIARYILQVALCSIAVMFCFQRQDSSALVFGHRR